MHLNIIVGPRSFLTLFIIFSLLVPSLHVPVIQAQTPESESSCEPGDTSEGCDQESEEERKTREAEEDIAEVNGKLQDMGLPSMSASDMQATIDGRVGGGVAETDIVLNGETISQAAVDSAHSAWGSIPVDDLGMYNAENTLLAHTNGTAGAGQVAGKYGHIGDVKTVAKQTIAAETATTGITNTVAVTKNKLATQNKDTAKQLVVKAEGLTSALSKVKNGSSIIPASSGQSLTSIAEQYKALEQSMRKAGVKSLSGQQINEAYSFDPKTGMLTGMQDGKVYDPANIGQASNVAKIASKNPGSTVVLDTKNQNVFSLDLDTGAAIVYDLTGEVLSGGGSGRQIDSVFDTSVTNTFTPHLVGGSSHTTSICAMTDDSCERGIRNNNLLNIELGDQWVGLVANPKEKRFVSFQSPELGFRAGAKVLMNYSNNYGINTISGIVTRWAPPQENNTPAYIEAVAKATGFDPNQTLDMNDPEVLTKLIEAMVIQENGRNPYDRDVVETGVNMALGNIPVETGTQLVLAGSAYDINLQLPTIYDGVISKTKTKETTTASGDTVGGVLIGRFNESVAALDAIDSVINGTDIAAVPGIKLEGLREGVLDILTVLKDDCGCQLIVTSATGGTHASGPLSHANGYKADLRSRDPVTGVLSDLTNFILNNDDFTHTSTRNNGDKVYTNPNYPNTFFALESDHWDIGITSVSGAGVTPPNNVGNDKPGNSTGGSSGSQTGSNPVQDFVDTVTGTVKDVVKDPIGLVDNVVGGLLDNIFNGSGGTLTPDTSIPSESNDSSSDSEDAVADDSNTFTLRSGSSGSRNVTVERKVDGAICGPQFVGRIDWGDGSVTEQPTAITGDCKLQDTISNSHTYDAPGTYTITIRLDGSLKFKQTVIIGNQSLDSNWRGEEQVGQVVSADSEVYDDFESDPLINSKIIVKVIVNDVDNTITLSRPDIDELVTSGVDAENQISFTSGLEVTPLVFDDNGEIIYSSGLYAPPVVNGEAITDGGLTSYVYIVERIDSNGNLVTVEDEQVVTSDNIFSRALSSVFSDKSEFSLEDVSSITYELIDPDSNIPADEYYEYNIRLMSGGSREVNVAEFSSVENMRSQFSSVGFTGDVLALIGMATEVADDNNVNFISRILSGTFNLIKDFVDAVVGGRDDTVDTVTDLPEVSGTLTSSDIKKIFVYQNADVTCDASLSANNAGYMYVVVLENHEAPDKATTITNARCGSDDENAIVAETARHLGEHYGIEDVTYESIVNKTYFRTEAAPLIPGVVTTRTTQISEDPVEEPDDNGTPTDVEEPTEDYLPNLTNEVTFEVKVVNSQGAIIQDWAYTDASISSGDSLYLRWNGTAYNQCLPFLFDNGNYALTRSNRAMLTGNTEEEQYNVTERTGVYRIECGGQRNNEYGVDFREINITVTN